MATGGDGRLDVGTRVTVGGRVPTPHDGTTGIIVRQRGVLGIPVYIVRLDQTGPTRKIDLHVELFATELEGVAAAVAAVEDAPAPALAMAIDASAVTADTTPSAPTPVAPESVAPSLFDPFFDKAWAGKDLAALADAPVDALHGVSADDALLLASAFGIRTVSDLALHPFVRTAQAITKFADAG